MSDSDSFIEEVTEEVRRDRLFGLMRRYGWIAVLAVLLLVGGAAWNEWRKYQERQAAQALGDAVVAALSADGRDARASALGMIDPSDPQANAIVTLLAAAESAQAAPVATAERLLSLADDSRIDEVYRRIATLKAVTLPDSGLAPQERAARLETMLGGQGVLRLLAEEQLALIEVETGESSAALDRLKRIVADAEATPGLRRRAAQVIVALGGEVPDTPGARRAPGGPVE